MKGFFKGSATAMITPFYGSSSYVEFDKLDDKMRVNTVEFGKMIEYQIENGTDALVVLGTTGEPATMTEKEKDAVMSYAIERVNGRAKVIVGTGSNCTARAVQASRRAQAEGADGILAVTPYYNKCTQKGIVEYYKAICDAVDVPVIAYNVPSRTGVNILPATAEELSYIPNMAGIKEACGNMEQICETMRRIRPRMDMYSGDDKLNIPILAIGGAGVISVASNIAPKQVKQVADLALACEFEKANAVQDRLLPLIDACFVEVNPIPVKAGCNMIGFDAGVPRSPLTELEEAHKETLRKAIEAVGVSRL